MRKFLKIIGIIFATLFSISFIVTALASLLFLNIERRLLNSKIYKDVLIKQQVYARLPRVLGEQFTMDTDFNMCADNPFLCENVTSEFLVCIQDGIGAERYAALASGQEQPTESDLQVIQPCIDQFGSPGDSGWQGENPLPGAPYEVLDCVRQGLGEETYNILYYGERQPSSKELNIIKPCFESAGMSLTSGGMPAFMKTISAADWELIIKIIMPTQEIQTLTEDLLDQVFAYLNGDIPYVVIDFTQIKDRLRGQAGMDAAMQFFQAQPACVGNQEFLLVDQIEFCNPGEEKLIADQPDIREQLDIALDQIPDQRVILQPQQTDNPGPLGSEGSHGVLRMTRFILRLFPDVPLGFLLIITLLVVRRPKSWLRWWGIPFFFTGLLAIAMAILTSAAFEQVWLTYLAGRIPSYLSLGLVTLGHDLARNLVKSFLVGWSVSALVLGLLGLGMWIGSYFVKDEQTAPAPLPPANEPVPPTT